MTATMQKAQGTSFGAATICCGARINILELTPRDRQTVGSVRKKFGITPGAPALLGDRRIPEDHVIRPGETVDFQEEAGDLG